MPVQFQPVYPDWSQLAGIGKSLGQAFRGDEHEPKWKIHPLTGEVYDEKAKTAPTFSQAGSARKPMTEYEYQRIQAAKEKAAKADKQANTRAEYYGNQADEIANFSLSLAGHKGLDAATGAYKAPKTGNKMVDDAIGGVTQFIPADSIPDKPEGDSAAFNSELETLKAKIGFAELGTMRQMALTGGALGQVAVQEIDWLQNSVESLAGIADPNLRRARLREIAVRYRKLGKLMREMKTDPSAVAAPDAGGDTGEYQEGNIADGPNGEVVVFQGGQWVPQ